MAAVQVGTHARMLFGELRTLDGVTFFDMLELPPLPVRPDDQVYVWQSGDRLQSVAYHFYRDTTLWWILALSNGIELAPIGLYPGRELRVPSPRYVLETYLTQARARIGR